MNHFSYSFAVSLMHSMWQAAVLLVFYSVISYTVKRHTPYLKRNLLFGLLAAQLFGTAITFIFYYTNLIPEMNNQVSAFLSTALIDNSWISAYSNSIFYVYALVVSYKFLLYVYHWIKFKNSYTSALIRPSADIRMFATSSAHHFGINKKIQLWYSEQISTPVVFGFIKPIILLPFSLVNNLSLKETEALIIHELAHIKNNDYLLNWFLVATETLYFFNPFIKIIGNKIKMEREKTCDIQVLHFNYHPVHYAEALLKIAKLHQQKLQLQLAAVNGKSQLLQRILFFSDPKNIIVKKNKYGSLSYGWLMIFLALNVFAVLHFISSQNNTSANVETQATAAANLSSSKSNVPSEAITLKTVNLQTIATGGKTYNKKVSEVKIAEQVNQPVAIETSAIPSITLTQVSYKTTEQKPEDQGHQVIINEESNDGKKVTKAYKVQLKNGEWIAEPLWIIAESKPAGLLKDSMKLRTDSLVHIIPSVQ